MYNRFPQAFGENITLFDILSSLMMSIFSPYMLATVWVGLLFVALGFVAELFLTKTIQPEKCYAVKKETGIRLRKPALLATDE